MGTHPIFESDFDCLTERMGKKGMGKGGKGKGGKGKKSNEKHDFLNARIAMREKALLSAEAQAAQFSDELDKKSKALMIVEKERDDQIRSLLAKLHTSDNDRADSVQQMNESIRSGRELLREANERRSTEEALKRAQLAELRQNNANLEGEIEKWETYRNEGSIQHSYIINGLEHKISEQHKNTEAMKKFIQKQIETAKADSEAVIRQIEANKRQQAMLDALNGLPGSMHECRKSEQLQKLVDWQGSAVCEDRDIVQAIRNDTRNLVREAAALRKAKFEAPRKSEDVLDWKEATTASPSLPSVEKAALSNNPYSTMFKNREMSESARRNPLLQKVSPGHVQ